MSSTSTRSALYTFASETSFCIVCMCVCGEDEGGLCMGVISKLGIRLSTVVSGLVLKVGAKTPSWSQCAYHVLVSSSDSHTLSPDGGPKKNECV